MLTIWCGVRQVGALGGGYDGLNVKLRDNELLCVEGYVVAGMLAEDM